MSVRISWKYQGLAWQKLLIEGIYSHYEALFFFIVIIVSLFPYGYDEVCLSVPRIVLD